MAIVVGYPRHYKSKGFKDCRLGIVFLCLVFVLYELSILLQSILANINV